MQRKTRNYKNQIPLSRKYPFLVQTRIESGNAYGGRKYDFKNKGVVFGSSKRVSEQERVYRLQAKEVETYKAMFYSGDVQGLSNKDRMVYLADESKPILFDVDTVSDPSLRGEYETVTFTRGDFTKKGSLKENLKLFFKGVGEVPEVLNFSNLIDAGFHLDLASDISDLNFIKSDDESGVLKVLALSTALSDLEIVNIKIKSANANFSKVERDSYTIFTGLEDVGKGLTELVKV